MIKRLRSILASSPAPAPATASVPEGERVYAIGDVHGRLDLFEQLVAAIDADDEARGPAETTVVLLGDLVDRGPDSSGVIDAAMAWGMRRRVRLLAGNHEEMFLDSLERTEVLRHFLRYGGKETVLSYPIDRTDYRDLSLDELRVRMIEAIPQAHIDYLRDAEDMIAIGDYLFVHAGIRP